MNMMLQSDVMKKQKCDICRNYLSIGPVVMSESREIICGRCSAHVKPHSFYVASIYNTLAENFIFKCRHHYSGCKELLEFNSTHEEIPEELTFNCPLCSYSGNGCQLSYHFAYWHSDNCLVNSSFKVKFEAGSEYTCFQDQADYLVVIHLLYDGYYLRIGVINLCKNYDLMKYSLQLFQEHNRFAYCINNVDILMDYDTDEYYEMDVEEVSQRFDWSKWVHGRIKLNPEENAIEKEYEFEQKQFQIKTKERELLIVSQKVEDKIDDLNRKLFCSCQSKNMGRLREIVAITGPALLTCIHCHATLTEDIYLCPKNHSFCRTCLNSKCSKCQSLCLWSSSSNILENIFLTCEWANCTELCNFKNYLRHKQRCPYRRYQCPDPACNFVGVQDELVKHWHFPEPSLRTEDEPAFLLKGDYEFFWLIKNYGELVRVKMLLADVQSANERHNLTLTIDEHQAVFPENYKIEFHFKKYLYMSLSLLKQVGTTKVLSLRVVPNSYYKLTVVPK